MSLFIQAFFASRRNPAAADAGSLAVAYCRQYTVSIDGGEGNKSMSTGSGAQALFREAEGQFPFAPDDLRSEVARDIEEFGRYDFQGIDEVVAIEPWGRSGSVLLASYFDGHDRVMALPALRSNGIY